MHRSRVRPERRVRAKGFELPENSPTTAYLYPGPTTVRASLTLDYSTAYKRSVLDDLFEAGTTTVADWPLAPPLRFGNERRQRPGSSNATARTTA